MVDGESFGSSTARTTGKLSTATGSNAVATTVIRFLRIVIAGTLVQITVSG